MKMRYIFIIAMILTLCCFGIKKVLEKPNTIGVSSTKEPCAVKVNCPCGGVVGVDWLCSVCGMDYYYE